VELRSGREGDPFAADLAAFLAEAMRRAPDAADPDDLAGVTDRFERDLHRAAGARGWFALDLPARRRAWFNYLVAAADAPLIDTAVTLVAYPIATFGTDAQRATFLPLVEQGAITVCIAYTEEAAGSDLGAQRAVARRDRDGWVLDGHKVLVTGAHKADWCLLTARTRTDVPARLALGMFLVDMRNPAITVTRRPTMNTCTLDEITFTAARVPADALVGSPDRGWHQLVTTVAAERSGLFHLGFARHVLDALVAYARATVRDGRRLADDPLVRDRVARLEVEHAAGLRLAERIVDGIETGTADPALPPMAKVHATELLQRLAQAATEIAGPAGLVHAPMFTGAPEVAAGDGRFAFEYLERVHGTIGGGANEVQRDAIAQLGLGLPRAAR
jgi:alkylation response protein AidB-like acyl-CoA dehydrogenase